MLTRANSPVVLSAGAAALLFFAHPALAQESSDAATQADLEFARRLSVEWGFVDLADEVLDGIASQLEGADAERLELLRSELIAETARLEQDPLKRRELYREALSGFESFLEQRAISVWAGAAQSAFVDTSYLFARYLERDLERAAGEERVAREAQLVEVVTHALDVHGAQSHELDVESARAASVLLQGRLLTLLASHADDGSYYYDRALEALTGLAMDLAGTHHELLAYKFIGDVYLLKGDWEEAAAYFEAVVEQALPRDPEQWQQMRDELELSLADVAARFRFLEIATAGLLESLTLAGDRELARAFALHFLNTWSREGLPLLSEGHESLLAVARIFSVDGGFVGGELAAGEGRWFATEEELRRAVRRRRDQVDAPSLALRLARRVLEDAPSVALQLRARALMGDIAQLPGVVLDPALQVQVAEGELQSGELQSASESLRALLAQLEGAGESERREFSGQAYHLLGRCFQRQQRRPEAALAFRTAVIDYRGGSPDLDLESALRYRRLMSDWRRGASKDVDPLVSLLEEAEETLLDVTAEHGPGRDVAEIHLRTAEELYGQASYAEARLAFLEIEPASAFGDYAQVMAAVCALRSDAQATGANELQAFLASAADDSQAATSQELPSQAALERRQHAVGIARYFLGSFLYANKDYAAAARVLEGYPRDHSGQANLAERAGELLVGAHAALDDLVAAEAALVALPEGSDFAQSAKLVYKAHVRARSSANEHERAEHLRRMAELLGGLRERGLAGYNELWNEAVHASELAGLMPEVSMKWTAAGIAALERVEARFGTDEAYARRVQRSVRPKLGELYLARGRVLDAHAVLTPLVIEVGASPSKQTVLAWVRASIGWLEGGGVAGAVRYQPGVGSDPAEFQAVIDRLVRIRSARDVERQGCESYALYAQIVLAYHAWSGVDSSKAASAQRQLGRVQIDLSEGWSMLDALCAGSSESPGLGVLRDRFRWLERALR